MSTKRLHSLKDVSSSSFNWNVKVRVIRLWRGFSNRGESFKGFNVLLLDDQNIRIHAFVPGLVAEKIGHTMIVGKIVKVSNFTVKDYKTDEKFRPIQTEKQIIFTNFTKVEPIHVDDTMIPNDMFDFYDLGDLTEIANDNTYLTDVIGVIEKDWPLSTVQNKHGNLQSQIKFKITDGRCSKNVTFWDSLAEEFAGALTHIIDFPPIVIIASAKITSWQDVIDIGNVTATRFYINYDHHSVFQLKNMIHSPLFEKHDFSSQIPEKLEKLCVQEILNVTYDYAEKEVISDLKLNFPEIAGGPWCFPSCTSCYKEIDVSETDHKCIFCNRIVPYPDKKLSVYVNGEDETGSIDIVLNDEVVRSLIDKTVFDIESKGKITEEMPTIIRTIGEKIYRVKLLIRKDNIAKTLKSHQVSDIYEIGLTPNKKLLETEDNLSKSMSQSSTSTLHLDGLSQMNFRSPEVNKTQEKKLKNKVT